MFFGTSKTNKKKRTVQEILGFKEIARDMICINDNEYRMVLECKKVNMNAKDDEEIEDVSAGFRETLQSMNFPVQWVIKTSILDLHAYLKNLEEKERSSDPIRQEILNVTRNHLIREIEEKKMTSSQRFLVLSYRIGQQKNEINNSPMDWLKSLIPKRNVFARMTLQEKMNEVSDIFKSIEDSISASLTKIGSGARRLSNEELDAILYRSYRHEMAIIQRWGNIPENQVSVKVGDGHAS